MTNPRKLRWSVRWVRAGQRDDGLLLSVSSRGYWAPVVGRVLLGKRYLHFNMWRGSP